MPIYGMTKAVTGENISKLPRIAKLRKGAPKEVRTNKEGRQYEVVGKDLDYFRIEFEQPYKDLLPIWESIYGYEPTEFLNVKVVGSTVDEAFENWREEWMAATMLHRCDGLNQSCHYDTTAHKYINTITPCCSPTDPETGKQTIGCACKPRGRLKLLFPRLIAETKVLGYIEVGTSSGNDIMDISGYLAGIQAMVGDLGNVRFRFGRAPREISTPKQEKQGNQYVTTGRAMREKSLFFIQVMPGYVGENILPAIDGEQASLPAPAVQFGIEEARQLTEGEDAEAEAKRKAEQAAQEEWVNDLAQVEKFGAWAKKHFKFSLEQIIAAFDLAVDYEVTNITQWRENGTVSMAAVIAAACSYDPKKIDKATSSNPNYTFDVYNAAIAIVEHVNAKQQPVAE